MANNAINIPPSRPPVGIALRLLETRAAAWRNYFGRDTLAQLCQRLGPLLFISPGTGRIITRVSYRSLMMIPAW